MRRHEKLIPLSRFHRSCLFLALMAKENAPHIKGYPTEIPEKIAYALSFYNVPLKSHFEKEALLWEQVKGKSEEIDKIVNDLSEERESLIQLFDSMGAYEDATTLHKLGDLLERHVRKEERVLFQQIQKDLTEVELSSLMF